MTTFSNTVLCQTSTLCICYTINIADVSMGSIDSIQSMHELVGLSARAGRDPHAQRSNAHIIKNTVQFESTLVEIIEKANSI